VEANPEETEAVVERQELCKEEANVDNIGSLNKIKTTNRNTYDFTHILINTTCFGFNQPSSGVQINIKSTKDSSCIYIYICSDDVLPGYHP
jgi:hypothetical protein